MKKLIIPIIGIFLIILTFLIILCINSNSSFINVSYIDTGFKIETKSSNIDVDFNDIEEIKLIDAIYDNIKLDGMNWNNCKIGIFKNELFERYYSFLHKKAYKMVVITFKNNNYGTKYLIVGLKQEKKTTELFDYLNSNI